MAAGSGDSSAEVVVVSMSVSHQHPTAVKLLLDLTHTHHIIARLPDAYMNDTHHLSRLARWYIVPSLLWRRRFPDMPCYPPTRALTPNQQIATPTRNNAKLTAVMSHVLSTRPARERRASVQATPTLTIKTAKPTSKSTTPVTCWSLIGSTALLVLLRVSASLLHNE